METCITSTEIAKRLSLKLEKQIKTNDVQKALEQLGYTEKIRKKIHSNRER